MVGGVVGGEGVVRRCWLGIWEFDDFCFSVLLDF